MALKIVDSIRGENTDQFISMNTTYMRLSAGLIKEQDLRINLRYNIGIDLDSEEGELHLIPHPMGLFNIIRVSTGLIISCSALIKEYNLNKKRLYLDRADKGVLVFKI